jgi:hypothetical protein
VGNILQIRLAELDNSIKADENAARELEGQLAVLYKRKNELLLSINKNKKFAQDYKDQIGPFDKEYDKISTSIAELYGDAKVKYYDGVELLKREFRYHPTFKRWNDDFSSTPFRPA